MSRYIDADAFDKVICNSVNEATNIGIVVDEHYLWGVIPYALENAPSIEIVRCGECEHYDSNRQQCSVRGWGWEANEFCSDGKRRKQ